MESITSFLNTNNGAIAILITVAVSLYKFFQYLNIKLDELREKKFKHYHDDLIKKLVQSENKDENIKLDRQIAIIYELKNFPEYFPVSKRILEGWIIKSDDKEMPERIKNEAKIAIKYMNKNIIARFISRAWSRLVGQA